MGYTREGLPTRLGNNPTDKFCEVWTHETLPWMLAVRLVSSFCSKALSAITAAVATPTLFQALFTE